MTKFLLLSFVALLIYWRVRRAVLYFRATAERLREAAERPAAQSPLPTIDLVTCSSCGESVPRQRAFLEGGGPLCDRCHAAERS